MKTLCMGVLLGLSIAVPPGPNAAICMSRTLAAGRKVAFRCGFGVASAHAVYASLAVVGADRASGLLERSTFALHIVGGVLLVALGLRLGRTRPVPTSGSTTRPYVTTLALGLGNPLTILADQGVLNGDGPLPTLDDPERPRPEEAPSPADGLIDEDTASVRCQRCGTDHLASAVWTLSTHPTSQGVVTYFRCPAGHADFYTTRR